MTLNMNATAKRAWPKPKVLIVGGGIGGLFLAILLEKAGIDYEVFERAAVIKPLGAGMSLGPNVMPAIVQMGLFDDFCRISKPMRTMDLFQERKSGAGTSSNSSPSNSGLETVTNASNASNNSSVVEPLTTIDFKETADKSGYEIRIFPRPRLFDLLLSRIPKEKIHLGKNITHFVQEGQEEDYLSPEPVKETKSRSKKSLNVDEVTIHCTDGSTYSGDILVGADGAYSAVRKTLYKQMSAKGQLPRQDLEQLNLGYVTMVGTTDPLDEEMFPEVKEEICRHLRTMGDSKPHTWTCFTVPDKRICFSVNAQVDPSLDSTIARTAEWSPESTEVMIETVRSFPIPAGRDGKGGRKVLGDLIDQTPRDGISKVFLEEKLFETWYHGRTVLLGDACHKLLPATGQGAVNAVEDAIILANCLYDLESNSGAAIQTAFKSYRDQRYPHAKLQYQGSKSVAKVIQGQTWIENLLRKVTLQLMGKRFEKSQNMRGLEYMPQVTFLPPIPARGIIPLLSQPHSDRYAEEHAFSAKSL